MKMDSKKVIVRCLLFAWFFLLSQGVFLTSFSYTASPEGRGHGQGNSNGNESHGSQGQGATQSNNGGGARSQEARGSSDQRSSQRAFIYQSQNRHAGRSHFLTLKAGDHGLRKLLSFSQQND